ncbi:MAG: glycosyltransferase family 4 protein [Chthoniobacteraceae bacterium]
MGTPHHGKKKLLVFSRQSVFPISSGSEMYCFDFLRHAAQEGWDIQCVITHPNYAGGVPLYRVPAEVLQVMKVHIPGCVQIGTRFIRPKVWVKEKMKAMLRKVFKNRFAACKFRTEYVWSAADAQEQALAAKWVQKVQPEAVLANYCWMTPCFPSNSESAKVLKIVLTHDAMHEAVAAYTAAGLANNDSHHDAASERALLSKADVILAISDDDATAFRRLLPAAKVLTMPKAAHVKRLGEAPVPGRCLFVGSGCLANYQGIMWFLENVWPLVRALVTEAHLRLAGRVSEKIGTPPPGVELLGLCESLESEYATASAVIVPLQVGSGVKIKLVEALAFGKACVSTSVGLQGLPFLTADEACPADLAEEFATSLARVLTDDQVREKLERNAFAAAQKYLTAEKVYLPVLRELEKRVTQSGQERPMELAPTFIPHLEGAKPVTRAL